MNVSRKEAAKHLLRIQDAENSFLGFVKLIHPDFVLADFQLDLIEKLDLLEKGLLEDDDGYAAAPRKIYIFHCVVPSLLYG